MARRNELETELDEALTDADLGEVMSVGAGPGAEFDLGVSVDPGRFKGALKVIRRVLASFDVPPTTRILEEEPDRPAPIEYPLKS